MSEQQLVDDFITYLTSSNSPWGKVKIMTEFFFHSGRTDILALTEQGDLIAFEAKLERWKEAAHQAYRNTAFANMSYVLLPEKTANRAKKNEHEFELRQVGLCSIVDGAVTIFRQAERLEPIHLCLHQKAVDSTLERL